MPKKSFRDSTTNVLKAWGYSEVNSPLDVYNDEPDDFNLEPGQWYFTDGTWQPYVVPLADRQTAKWETIKSYRAQRQEGGVHVGDKWFHSDSTSRIQQLGLVLMGANIPANLQWKTMDGTFVTMTQTLANQIFSATAASDQSIFSIAQDHYTAMMVSASPETYNFSANWPATYTGA